MNNTANNSQPRSIFLENQCKAYGCGPAQDITVNNKQTCSRELIKREGVVGYRKH
jgi:hypothetical protein